MIAKTFRQVPRIQEAKFQIRTHSSYPPVEGAFSEEDILAARLKVTKVVPFQQASPPYINTLTLAVVSGLLLVLAFPNWNLWSLGWVGTAPLIMAVAREQKFWRSALLGWVTGTIFYAGTSHWITYSMHHYGGLPVWLSYLLLLVAAAAIGSFTAVFAGVLGLAIKSFGGWAILSAPILWAASEWLRLQLAGLGWNALGYSQAFQPLLIQSAQLGGVYLVSAFLVAMSTAIVFSLIYLGYKRGWVVLSVALLLAIVVVLTGISRNFSEPPARSLGVLVVQPNLPIEGDWSDDRFVEQMLLRHITLSEASGAFSRPPTNPSQVTVEGMKGEYTERMPNSPKIRLVIWPESPIGFQYEKDAALRQRLADFTRRHEVYLLISSWGVPQPGDAAETIYNSALLIGPDGELQSRYDKIALMPFGEYVPMRGILPLVDRIPALVADTAAGAQATVSDAAGVRFGTMICFEAMRPDLARAFRRQGATALVQSSNEAWFGPSSMARQMLAQAVFRAVENNVDLLRVTNSGASAQVTRYGEIVDETPLFQTATRLWSISTGDEAQSMEATAYTRGGDLFAITSTGLSVLLLAAAVTQEILKKRKEAEDHD